MSSGDLRERHISQRQQPAVSEVRRSAGNPNFTQHSVSTTLRDSMLLTTGGVTVGSSYSRRRAAAAQQEVVTRTPALQHPTVVPPETPSIDLRRIRNALHAFQDKLNKTRDGYKIEDVVNWLDELQRHTGTHIACLDDITKMLNSQTFVIPAALKSQLNWFLSLMAYVRRLLETFQVSIQSPLLKSAENAIRGVSLLESTGLNPAITQTLVQLVADFPELTHICSFDDTSEMSASLQSAAERTCALMTTDKVMPDPAFFSSMGTDPLTGLELPPRIAMSQHHPHTLLALLIPESVAQLNRCSRLAVSLCKATVKSRRKQESVGQPVWSPLTSDFHAKKLERLKKMRQALATKLSQVDEGIRQSKLELEVVSSDYDNFFAQEQRLSDKADMSLEVEGYLSETNHQLSMLDAELSNLPSESSNIEMDAHRRQIKRDMSSLRRKKSQLQYRKNLDEEEAEHWGITKSWLVRRSEQVMERMEQLETRIDKHENFKLKLNFLITLIDDELFPGGERAGIDGGSVSQAIRNLAGDGAGGVFIKDGGGFYGNSSQHLENQRDLSNTRGNPETADTFFPSPLGGRIDSVLFPSPPMKASGYSRGGGRPLRIITGGTDRRSVGIQTSASTATQTESEGATRQNTRMVTDVSTSNIPRYRGVDSSIARDTSFNKKLNSQQQSRVNNRYTPHGNSQNFPISRKSRFESAVSRNNEKVVKSSPGKPNGPRYEMDNEAEEAYDSFDVVAPAVFNRQPTVDINTSRYEDRDTASAGSSYQRRLTQAKKVVYVVKSQSKYRTSRNFQGSRKLDNYSAVVLNSPEF